MSTFHDKPTAFKESVSAGVWQSAGPMPDVRLTTRRMAWCAEPLRRGKNVRWMVFFMETAFSNKVH